MIIAQNLVVVVVVSMPLMYASAQFLFSNQEHTIGSYDLVAIMYVRAFNYFKFQILVVVVDFGAVFFRR